MGVPGLTGSWQQRNAQYYKALGSPMGAYTGSLQQNLYLLDQIKKKNFPQAPAPQPVAQPAAQPAQPIADQYAAQGVAAGQAVSARPSFQEAMPFYDAWGRLAPQATLAAESQVNPEMVRQYKAQSGDYMRGMTSAGGQRFGTGLAGLGEMKAAAERERNAQLQDWLGAYQKGYKELFYSPSETAWNLATTQAPNQDLLKIPTWADVYDKYNTMYGGGAATPQAGFEGGSPFYSSQPKPPSY